MEASSADASQVAIYPAGGRIMVLLVASLVFLGMGCLFALLATAHPSAMDHVLTSKFVRSARKAFALLIAVASIGIGLRALWWSLAQMLRPRPILTLSARGISGIGAIAGGSDFLAWPEIATIRKTRSAIVLDLKNPGAVMARAGLLRRAMMRMTRWSVGSPVIIQSGILPMPLDELEQLITSRHAMAVMQ